MCWVDRWCRSFDVLQKFIWQSVQFFFFLNRLWCASGYRTPCSTSGMYMKLLCVRLVVSVNSRCSNYACCGRVLDASRSCQIATTCIYGNSQLPLSKAERDMRGDRNKTLLTSWQFQQASWSSSACSHNSSSSSRTFLQSGQKWQTKHCL